MSFFGLYVNGELEGVIEADALPDPNPLGFVPLPGWTTWEAHRTEEQQWTVIRARRAPLLAASDWVAARAFETATAVPTDWAAYRQALRDITEQADPFNITWPTPPAA